MFYNKELGQNIIVNPKILPDVEAKAGATDLPTWEGGVPMEGTQDDATVATTNVVEPLQNLDQVAVMSRSGCRVHRPQ
jgi:hypothetical protein